MSDQQRTDSPPTAGIVDMDAARVLQDQAELSEAAQSLGQLQQAPGRVTLPKREELVDEAGDSCEDSESGSGDPRTRGVVRSSSASRSSSSAKKKPAKRMTLQVEHKIALRRQKNREYARKSRQRKRTRVQELEMEVSRLRADLANAQRMYSDAMAAQANTTTEPPCNGVCRHVCDVRTSAVTGASPAPAPSMQTVMKPEQLMQMNMVPRWGLPYSADPWVVAAYQAQVQAQVQAQAAAAHAHFYGSAATASGTAPDGTTHKISSAPAAVESYSPAPTNGITVATS